MKYLYALILGLGLIAQAQAQNLPGQARWVRTVDRAALTNNFTVTVNRQTDLLTDVRMAAVRLHYPATGTVAAADWSYSLTYTLRAKRAGQTTFTPAENGAQATLLLNSTGSGTQQVFTALRPYPGVDWEEVELTVVSSASSGTVPNGVQLQVELYEQTTQPLFASPNFRFYKTTPTDQTEALLHWDYVIGAYEYELEWVWIDAYDHGFNGSLYTPEFPFGYKEPARIVTPNQFFRLPLTYGAGSLFFRVRAVGFYPGANGRSSDQGGYKGPWNYGYNPAQPINSQIVLEQLNTDFEENRLWQSVTTFAEDGKFKKVVSYYDGSQRPRQALTNLSTEEMVLVAESKYDLEGRAVAQVLPVPLPGRGLNMRLPLNRFVGTGPQKALYDRPNATSPLSAPLDQAVTGAAQYYSNQNPDLAKDDKLARLPAANGFAYAQTVYMNDNTGRVARQGGVGDAFQVGGGRDTRFFYGNPNREELHRLFGSNVGLAARYKKNLVVDPNGQASVSYLDQEGRTIATALAGQPPASLLPLTSDQPTTMNVDLAFNQQWLAEERASRLNYTVLNTVPNTQYTFDYQMPTPNCDSCTYRLQLRVEGPNGQTIGTPQERTFRAGDCPTTEIKVVFTATELGNYVIYKYLQVLDPDMAAWREQLLASPAYQAQRDLIIAQQEAKALQACESCQDNAGNCEEEATSDEELNQMLADMILQGIKAQTRSDLEAAWKAHPEYCHYETVKRNGPSLTFERKMADIENWTQAVATYGVARLNASFWQSDPYFSVPGADGYGRRNNLQAKLEALTTPRTGIIQSIELVAQAMANQVTLVSSNNPGLDVLRWQFFRSLYMEQKELLRREVNIARGCPYLEAETALVVDPTKQLRDPALRTLAGLQARHLQLLQDNPELIPTQADQVRTWGDYLLGLCPALATHLGELNTILNAFYAAGGNSEYRYLPAFLYIDDRTSAPAAARTQAAALKTLLESRGCPDAYPAASLQAYCEREGFITIADPNSNQSEGVPGNATSYFGFYRSFYTGGFRDQTIRLPLVTSEAITTGNFTFTFNVNGLTAPVAAAAVLRRGGLTLVLNQDGSYTLRVVGAAPVSLPKPTHCAHRVQIMRQGNLLTIRTLRGDGTLASETVTLPANWGFTAQEIWTLGGVYQPAGQAAAGYLNGNLYNITVNHDGGSDFWPLDGDLSHYTEGADRSAIFTATDGLGPDFGPLACFNQTPVPTPGCTLTSVPDPYDSPVTAEQIYAACRAQARETALLRAEDRLAEWVDALLTARLRARRATCARPAETLRLGYTLREHHYTLYYYDQAGNLVQTVPPKGVVADGNGVHAMTTRYRHNSLEQPLWQSSPDGGASTFTYDRKARLRLSQNAKQVAGRQYSYTNFDVHGRTTQVGQVQLDFAGSNPTAQELAARLDAMANDPAFPRQGTNNVVVVNPLSMTAPTTTTTVTATRTQVTFTQYDMVNSLALTPAITALGFRQTHLRGRVSSTSVAHNGSIEQVSTMYSYDPHGNVAALVQTLSNVATVTNIHKKIEYAYDLISGKVNQVWYQKGQSDQFAHRYAYDADNRLLRAETSIDGLIWQREAEYLYYAHGPLARTELGHYGTQGLDYTYTLQGWLKGVNDDGGGDPGRDGQAGTARAHFAPDAVGYSLGYYQGDYTPVGTPPYAPGQGAWASARTGRPDASGQLDPIPGLYNGNIAWMATRLGPANPGTQLMAYRYDQLNRLRVTQANIRVGNAWVQDNRYRETFAYDPNGNITALTRFGATNAAVVDNLAYNYIAPSSHNRLGHVAQAPGSSGGIANQTAGNYQYDPIGNLTRDASEGITAIDWTVYGKVASVTKNTGGVTYLYDAAGQRAAKTVAGVTTHYVRDASGNVMAIYENNVLKELPIYGSSRLGVYKVPATGLETDQNKLTLGRREYELSNHLGNVLATISDVKLPAARVLSHTDYYAFGSAMPGRSGGSYRYGFNGKEKSGGDDFYDFEARNYYEKIGRFISIDPLSDVTPSVSPYAYAFNNPIVLIDEDGECPIIPFLLKAGAAGATEVMLQVCMNYFFDDKVQTVEQAFKKVDWKEVGQATLEGAIPWKVPGGKLGKAGALALKDVIANYAKHKLDGKEYTSEQAVQDFLVGTLSNLAGDGIGDLVAKYGEKKVMKVLKKLGIDKFACFVAGTEIHTREGFKDIEDITLQDSIYAYDEKTGKIVLKPVAKLFVKQIDKLFEIQIGDEVILTTAEHPFYIKGEWIKAEALRAGDSLFLYEGVYCAIDKVRVLDTLATVYNFEVADAHTYYVSKMKILVHNNCDDDGISYKLKRPQGVSDEEWNKKLNALNKAAEEGKAAIVHNPVRDGKAQKDARKQGMIKDGDDADHGLDLQFGGTDTIDNIQSTNSKVNRSVGAQGKQRLQYKNGTKINKFEEDD